MKIGILGGSFDPPHINHVLIAQQLIEFGYVESVWFMPVYEHTFDKKLSPVADRIAMTQLLNVVNSKVSTIEIDNKLDGNTINLISILQRDYPSDEFFFVIGTDQLTTFTKWGEWEKLSEAINFLVVPRPEYPSEPLYGRMRVVSEDLWASTTVSSTLIRNRVKKGLSIHSLVPDSVAAYIKEKQLYR